MYYMEASSVLTKKRFQKKSMQLREKIMKEYGEGRETAEKEENSFNRMSKQRCANESCESIGRKWSGCCCL